MNNNELKIKINEFGSKIFSQWDAGWFLLTCGDFQNDAYNAMTISWGGFGIMWNMPIAMIVVRPSRYTYGFINNHDTFTLSAFPSTYREALNLLGTKSGRDGDKIAESGLTPIASGIVPSPFYAEAELSIACKKIYFDDFNPINFLDDRIEKQYGGSDYHRMVFGEILMINGNPKKFT